MFYFWLGIVIFLGILEAITINLLSIWFVISGLFSLVLSFFSDNFVLQFGIFVVGGILFMILTRDSMEKKLLKQKEKTNLDRVIGMKGIVTEEIKDMKVGEVKVDGKKWSAISNKDLPKGSTIKVLKIKGVKLEVESWEE